MKPEAYIHPERPGTPETSPAEETPESLPQPNQEDDFTSHDKRFVLSRESFAQEKIQALKDSIKELQAQYPEILSFCLYGSLSKGTANEQSDIDGFLFIDLEALKKRFPEDEKLVESDAPEGENGNMLLRRDLQRQFKDLLIASLRSRIELTDKQVEHIIVRPISPAIIEKGIKQSADRAEALQRITEYQIHMKKIFSEHPEEEWDSLTKAMEKPGLPSTSLAKAVLYRMFHLEIGGGVRKYRHYLLGRLAEMGEIGEQVWTNIIESTETFEHSNRLAFNSKIRYPMTLAEAQELYGKH